VRIQSQCVLTKVAFESVVEICIQGLEVLIIDETSEEVSDLTTLSGQR